MHTSYAAVSRALRAAAAAALVGGAALAGEAAPGDAAVPLTASTAMADVAPPAPASPAAPAAPALDAAPTPAPAVDAAPALDAASPAPVLDAPLPPPPVVGKGVALGRRKHILGLQIDAGVPDVGGVSVLYRPWKALRFAGGMLYNTAGYGVRGGVSVQPYFPIAPSLSVEAGHYFGGNVYQRLSSYTTVDDNLKPILSDLGYTFVNASVGLEVGHPDWFVFFIRGGLSKTWLNVRNANSALPAPKPGDEWRVSYVADPTLAKFGTPNVKLGFMLFFY